MRKANFDPSMIMWLTISVIVLLAIIVVLFSLKGKPFAILEKIKEAFG